MYSHNNILFDLHKFYSVPLTNVLCVFMEVCDESSTVSDGEAKSLSRSDEAVCSVWLSSGGVDTSSTLSFCF